MEKTRKLLGGIMLLLMLIMFGCTTTGGSEEFYVNFYLVEQDDLSIEGKSVYNTQKITEGKYATNLSMERADYTFYGWYDLNVVRNLDSNQILQANKFDFENTKITKEYDYVGFFVLNSLIPTYEIKFELTGGTSLEELDKVLTLGETLNLPTEDSVSRDNSYLNGWKEKTSNQEYNPGDQIIVDSNMTFEAIWLAGNYIEYISSETERESITYKPNSTIKLPVSSFEKPGYQFYGWLYNNQILFAEADFLINQDLQFQALYVGDYNVSFNLDSGQGTIPNPTSYKSFDSITLPESPTKENHRFIGWSDGTNTYDANSNYEVTFSDVEFIAIYESLIKSYRVRFIDWDGTILKNETVNENGSATAPTSVVIDVPEFTGWNMEFNNVTENIDVYATYTHEYLKPSSYIFTLNTETNRYRVTSASKLLANLAQVIYLPHSYRGLLVEGISDFTDMPANTQEIGFFQCTFITKVVVPSTYQYIGSNAFFNCVNLTEIEFSSESQLLAIGRSAFYSTGLEVVNFPNSLQIIGDSVFHNCDNLTTVTFGENLVTIGSSAFSTCILLKDVVLPESLKTISNSAFNQCFSLESIIIPKNVETLAFAAFYSCTSLKTVTFLTDKLTVLTQNSFFNDPITELVIPSSVKQIDKGAFYNTAITKVSFQNNVSNLETIGEIAFGNSSKLVSFNSNTSGLFLIPASVKKIENYAFVRSLLLENVQFEEGSLVTEIGKGAFSGYDETSKTVETNKLKSFTIPATLKVLGEMAFYGCDFLETIIVEEGNTAYQIINNGLVETASKKLIAYPMANPTTELVLSSEINMIASEVFKENKYLKKITFSDSIVEIGTRVFEGALELTEVNLSKNLTNLPEATFTECKKLETVNFNNNNQIEVIENDAFLGCINLLGIVIPDSVTTIGEYAFAICPSLAYVTFSDNSNLAEIKIGAFYTNVAYDENINYELKSLVLPKSLKIIGQAAFSYLKGLTSVTFNGEATLEEIVAQAFSYSGLTTFTLPKSVTTIGTEAFLGCADLTTFNFEEGNKMTAIPDNMFSVSGIKTISIPSNFTEIGNNAFSYSSLESITMTDNVTVLNGFAFANCRKLTDVNLSNNITILPIHTFASCSGLTQITLPMNLVTISNFAFYDCSKLEEITIPEKVENIGMSAFSTAISLKTVRMLPVIPPRLENAVGGTTSESIVSSVFINCPLENIYVKNNSLNYYRTEWSYYSQFIKTEGEITND